MILTIPYTTATGTTERVPACLDGRRRWIVPPDIMRLGKQLWGLRADAVKYDGRHLVRYRRGFQWDGSSVPAPLHFYEAPDAHLWEALGHDQGHQYHWLEIWSVERNEWIRVRVSKAYVDAEFRAELAYAGTRVTKAWNMWLHVNIYGWLPWLRGTCNGRCVVCPCNARAWCPYVRDLPPMSDRKLVRIELEAKND